MEDVPYEFCRSVAHVLAPTPGYDLFYDNRNENNEPLPSAAWQSAIDVQLKDRVDVECSIGYKDGVWSYCIAKERFHQITFEELQIIDRQNLRIRSVDIHTTEHHQASFEEITKLVKFAVPFVNMASLEVLNPEDFPQNDLLNLLGFLCNSSIGLLHDRSISDEMWAVLSVHLKSNSLKRLSMWNENISARQRSALTDYILHKSFVNVFIFDSSFPDMDLFKFLFHKPQTEPRWTVYCHSSIDLEELRDFQKHLQVSSENTVIEWKREDGLVVHAFIDCIRFN